MYDFNYKTMLKVTHYLRLVVIAQKYKKFYTDYASKFNSYFIHIQFIEINLYSIYLY
jgi:hypothetical protein